MSRSALVTSGVDSVSLSLAGAGSGVDDVTVAVFTMGSGDV
jgi:hypothetical protein